MEVTKEAMKKQFNKKRQNLQDLKKEYNMWLKAKNIHLKQPSKKLHQKRYGSFKITKDIGQEVFQLKLLEGWTIHNIFNKDLLTQCREPQFKGQHIDIIPPQDIINKEEEYEVEEICSHRK